jgi:transcription initiation factor IIE alpha subunit
LIDINHETTEGMCGLTIPDLQEKSGIKMEKLKIILRQLYEEKYIKVREGLNGKLIFKKI